MKSQSLGSVSVVKGRFRAWILLEGVVMTEKRMITRKIIRTSSTKNCVNSNCCSVRNSWQSWILNLAVFLSLITNIFYTGNAGNRLFDFLRFISYRPGYKFTLGLGVYIFWITFKLIWLVHYLFSKSRVHVNIVSHHNLFITSVSVCVV